jgi:long-chain acyl-CoA synthetase
MTLDEAHARLTAPGAPFETVEQTVRGIPMRVWKHVPATAAQAFAAARAFGPREFLVLDEERVSYDGFARAVLKLSALLRARGLKKGERVALAMRNLPEWPVVFLAGLLAGAIMVPLNARWTAAELAYGIADSGARFVFADGERLARLLQGLPGLAEGGGQVFAARAAVLPPGVTALEDVIGAPAHWPDLPPGALPDVPLAPEDDATIFYTSGTTGAPKGALGTHRALTTNIFARPFLAARNALRDGTAAAARRGETAQGVTLLAVPFFHVVGSLSVMLPAMAAGGKLVLMEKFEAEAALRLIAREKVAVTGGVPAIALALLEHPRRHAFDLSSLKLVSYGGAPSPADLPARIAAAFAGASAGNGWGMTETSATCTSHSGRDYLHRRESCGPALPVSRIKVLVDGRAAAPGQVGELWAFGPNVVKGYWNRPQASARQFRDGWVKTGDLASIDAEGFCTIVDRAIDMVIRGGENIYCTEVENVLARHPAVADAALVGLAHPLLGQVPAALVQARAPVSEQALRDFAAVHLAAYKVPERILISPRALPRNAGGKLVRRDLAKAFAPKAAS